MAKDGCARGAYNTRRGVHAWQRERKMEVSGKGKGAGAACMDRVGKEGSVILLAGLSVWLSGCSQLAGGVLLC